MLKILAQILATYLQLAISDMIGSEQNYAVKGRSIQDNLYLVCEVLERINDSTEATLINLDQFKAFDRVNNRCLTTVLKTTRFKLEFRKWINMLDHNTHAVVEVNEERSEVFPNERSVWQGCLRSLLPYIFALEPLHRRLKDEGTNPALREVPFASLLIAKVSVYADDITVFVSRRLDIKAVKKAVVWNEQLTRTVIKFDKSEGM